MEILDCQVDPNFRKIISIRNYHGNDIEQKALELYQCLYNVSKSDEKYVYIYLRITNPNRHLTTQKRDNIGVKVPKNFKIILLSSLRHLKVYDRTLNFPIKPLVHVIVKDVLRTLDYLDFRTLYLFKVLDQIVLRKLDLLNDILNLLLSKLYEVCYSSPIAILKNSAVSIIHKIELKMGKGLKAFDPLNNIGIITNYDETKIKLEQVKTDSIHLNLQEYMKFIHKYFHFNVYNKVAGILYKAVISRYSINGFKTHIWPFWCQSFEKHRESREFQQSFLKYWIPFSIQEYETDLYIFLRDQSVPHRLLVEILYELRRKRHVSIENLSEGKFSEDFIHFFENSNTSDKAFEILCTFPSMNERIPVKYLEIFKEYFLGCKVHCCNSEKHASAFLAHIFMSEHISIEKNGSSSIYNNFVRKLRDTIVDSLNEEKNYELSLILCKILVGMRRTYKDLKLKYDIPKKYQYGLGQNKYLSYLEDNGILDIFTELEKQITGKLVKIFNENDSCYDSATWLLKHAFSTFDAADLNAAGAKKEEDIISLRNLEKYTNCLKLCLYINAIGTDRNHFTYVFLMIEEELIKAIFQVKISEEFSNQIFNILKMLNGLAVANQMEVVKEWRPSMVMYLLDFMVEVVKENRHEGLSVRTRKVLENLFCKILEIIRLSPNALNNQGDTILNKLVGLIEKSNMRKVVTDVLTLVPIISEKMATSGKKTQKLLNKFFKELLDVIIAPGKLDHLQTSRMRKHPRLRSLLHAVCKGAAERQREFVIEAVRRILWKSLQLSLDPTVQTVLLECLEIMLVEPNFHNFTSVYLEESIKLGLSSFRSGNWSVKNAAIQLTNTIISRIFGVQQTDNIRLRSFQEFCVLFPRLPDYFYNILSSPSLDDGAIIVLQYFSASEVLVYEHRNEEVQKKIEKFLSLLNHLLLSKENYIIKFIPHAFVNLCVEKRYPYYMKKVVDFVVSNLGKKPSNIIVNHLILFKEFVRKINENYSYLKPMKVNIETSIIQTVNKMNNFLQNKDVQYLDLQNIRYFVLDQCSESCRNALSVNVSLKRWNLYNFVVNFPSDYISRNFDELFEIMYVNVGLNFLLEIFLDQTITYAVENQDLDLISKIFNVLTTRIFCLKTEMNTKLNRILLESTLKLSDFVEHITFDIKLCDNIKELNFYQAVVINIFLSKKNCENRSVLCNEAFKKLSQFRSFGNFELELIPKVLTFIYGNLDVLNRYSFLKFLFCLVLTDCNKEDICDFLKKLCRKSVDEDNYMSYLLTHEFLYEFFEDAQVVQQFLKDVLKLIKLFEKKTKFATFYMDTYQSLQVQTEVINKMLLKLYLFVLFQIIPTFFEKLLICPNIFSII